MRAMWVNVAACALTACAWAATAWAKTLTIPASGIQVAQLHEELLARFPQWRGLQRADGIFSNPLLRLEYDDERIILTVPEEADEDAIHAVVDAHVPRVQSINGQPSGASRQ